MRPIVRLILSIVVIVFVVGLLGFGISRFMSSESDDKSVKTVQQESQNPSQDRSERGASSATRPSSTGVTGPTNVGSTGIAAGASTGTLVNSGPGETIALFIAVTVGATVIHNVYRRKTV